MDMQQLKQLFPGLEAELYQEMAAHATVKKDGNQRNTGTQPQQYRMASNLILCNVM